MAPVVTRRHLLVAASSLATLRAAGSSMKLSITVRIAEVPGSNQKTTMGFEEVVDIARKTGYEAIDMRASQGGVQTPQAKLRDMRKVLDKYGIRVSCVTGDFDVPSNNDKAPDGLRNIAPYLDVAEILGADLIRIGMKKEEDIAAARRACDQARERKIRLGHEAHQGTLFETVAGSLDVLKRVNRPNFGLIYEAGNWMVAGQDYGPETIQKFKPWIMNVFIQNYRITANGKSTVATWCPSPKTYPTWKPCYIRALANEANQVKEHVKSAGRQPCNTTLRAPHSASPGLPNPVAIDMETRALGPRIFGEPGSAHVSRIW